MLGDCDLQKEQINSIDIYELKLYTAHVYIIFK